MAAARSSASQSRPSPTRPPCPWPPAAVPPARSSRLTGSPAPATPRRTPPPPPAPTPGTSPATTSGVSPRPGCVTGTTTAWTTATSCRTAPPPPAGLMSGSAAQAAVSPWLSSATQTMTVEISQVVQFSFLTTNLNYLKRLSKAPSPNT